jgi:hypothetical protein
VIIASFVIVKAAFHPGPGTVPAGGVSLTAPPAPPPKPKPKTTSALMNALILANQSADAKGLLPPSTCKQDNSVQVTCTAPVVGISGVVFRTYPNLTALYSAYIGSVVPPSR